MKDAEGPVQTVSGHLVAVTGCPARYFCNTLGQGLGPASAGDAVADHEDYNKFHKVHFRLDIKKTRWLSLVGGKSRGETEKLQVLLTSNYSPLETSRESI